MNEASQAKGSPGSGNLALYAMFFCSGLAGLVYQVVWVRQFGNVFGSSVYSAALVTGVFMSGLGLGGYLAGRIADKRYGQPGAPLLKLYAYFELGIGVLGLLIAALWPFVTSLSAATSWYEPGENGWLTLSATSYLLRYATATALLLPSTVLMGGTLTLLIRHLLRSDLSLAGWRIGALYGANTAGAAAGALIVDFAFVPIMGLFATQATAAVVNLAVAVVAFRWAARSEQADEEPREHPSRSADEKPGGPAEGVKGAKSVVALTAGAIFLSGFGAMGMEILWFRYIGAALGARRATFSLLLCVVLLGIWLGSIAGGALERRYKHPALFYAAAQGLFVAVALGLLMLVPPASLSVGDYSELYASTQSTLLKSAIESWAQLRPIFAVTFLPACLMGFAYPLANAMAQKRLEQVGRLSGLLYFANTMGAVVGTVTTGFLLIPSLGMQRSILVLSLASLSAVLPVLATVRVKHARSPDTKRLLLTAGISVAVGLTAFVFWVTRPEDYVARGLHGPVAANERMLHSSESVNESIAITEDTGTGARRLYTNAHPMSSTRYEAQRYMRAFSHIPLLMTDEPRRVLVICFGVGNTLHAASLHQDLQRLDAVDLSAHVVSHAPFFARWNHNVLNDERVQVHINDGRQHLRMQSSDFYDLITLEPPPLSHAGTSSLYTRDFYQLARERLTPGGFVTQWLPAYQVPPHITAALIGAFVEVFPQSVILSGFSNEFILMGRKDADVVFDPEAVSRRLTERPEVEEDLRSIDLASLAELAGTFLGTAEALRNTASTMPPLTDDYPIMEYGFVIFRNPSIPATLFEPERFGSWCPRCSQHGGLSEDEANALRGYLAYMNVLHASRPFRTGPLNMARIRSEVVRAPREALVRAHDQSGYVRRFFIYPEVEIE